MIVTWHLFLVVDRTRCPLRAINRMKKCKTKSILQNEWSWSHWTRQICCYYFYCLHNAHILERRVFHRTRGDKLEFVVRTLVSRLNKFHDVAQQHFFVMLLVAFDPSPDSMDGKWFEYTLVLDFDYIVMDNLYERRKINTIYSRLNNIRLCLLCKFHTVSVEIVVGSLFIINREVRIKLWWVCICLIRHIVVISISIRCLWWCLKSIKELHAS